MTHLRLTLACGPYDRTQALRDGTIRPEGIELNYVTLQPAEIFWRMLQYKEFDASEMSLSNYTTLVSGGASPFVAIPVFPQGLNERRLAIDELFVPSTMRDTPLSEGQLV